MSIFNELLPKINDISKTFTKNLSEYLETAFQSLDTFEADLNANSKAREQSQKNKNQTIVLQSIHEEEDATTKTPDSRTESSQSSGHTSSGSPERGSKKRSKHEVEGMESPEIEKRPKRNASVRAQMTISEQVNLNLTKKIRRETTNQKRRRRKDDDKENDPEPIVQVKQEKISIPPESIDMGMLPITAVVKEEMAMPPPPVPKPRKKVDKPEEAVEEETTRRRTRNRKQTDTLTTTSDRDSRTRRGRPGREAHGNTAQDTTTEPGSDTAALHTEAASPAEKPRPKRTKRVQKASEKKEAEKEIEKPEPEIKENGPKECLEPYQSPVLQKIKPKTNKPKVNEPQHTDQNPEIALLDETDAQLIDNHLEKTKLISQLNCTVTINKDMDSTIVLPNGVYNHAPVTPKDVRQMNETVVLEKERSDDKHIMNATVVIEGGGATNNTSASSLLTDDSSPPGSPPPPGSQPPQTASAVKEKVQQFEEMASRVTRTKTRAMTKKEEPSESQTPPEKTAPAITKDTLSKMNNMIFNGKPPVIPTSATKPRTNIPLKTGAASASKLSAIRAQEEEGREKEDARSKKEALLEAKREQQRSKREQKMSAAALARSLAAAARRAALQAAARGRQERQQAQADQGRAEREREAERRRLEHARRAADTEERRQEEQARARKRADEQRKADDLRRRQREEASNVKKEAALMQKEIERRQKEFMERMKMKQKIKGDRTTPLKPSCAGAAAVEPVYMQDGFQHLNSDEEEPPPRPAPAWAASKARRAALLRQSALPPRLVDQLFSVREHSPDLREIFPNIERARLKRTSSAVWRTPPRLTTLQE